MANPEPPPGGTIERTVKFIASLNLTNILILALIIVIAIPTYFAYRFIADENFRRDFMTTASILDKHLPCVVLEGRLHAHQTRHSIVVVYGLEGRLEKLVGLRAPGELTDTEIEDACQKVLAMAAQLKGLTP